MLRPAAYTPERFPVYPAGHMATVVDPITADQRAAWTEDRRPASRHYDLLVVGGGLSGVAGAVAARRRGLTVLLIEPTHMLGGQATAAGVSAFDIPFPYDHEINDHGIWGEIVARTLRVYADELHRPANVGHYRNSSLTPNAVVVERILTEFVKDEGVETIRRVKILQATRNGPLVSGAIWDGGSATADVVIDATEDGSFLALAGVPHRLANRKGTGKTYWPAGVEHALVQDITYTATIREYPGGVPEHLRVPEAPEGYDRYVPGLRKMYPPAGQRDPRTATRQGPLAFAGYRAAPDLARSEIHQGLEWEKVTRTNLNLHNDLPIRGDYFLSDDARMRYEAKAIGRTLSVLYYLQTELGLHWSLATDEGFDGANRPENPYIPTVFRHLVPHLPLIPYIRECRRILGKRTLIGRAIRRPGPYREAPWDVDSVAVGYYHTDLHGGRRPEDFEADLNESVDDKPKSETFGPFPIPLGCLIPEYVDGFIAAEKNISVSRLAAGAIRVHPTVCAIGEAAGVLAALSHRLGVQPREVATASVQYELARGGALITPLQVEGSVRSDPAFAAISLAVARRRLPWQVRRDPHSAYIQTDVGVAEELGRQSIDYLTRNGLVLN